jgi:hypothetical protein
VTTADKKSAITMMATLNLKQSSKMELRVSGKYHTTLQDPSYINTLHALLACPAFWRLNPGTYGSVSPIFSFSLRTSDYVAKG